MCSCTSCLIRIHLVRSSFAANFQMCLFGVCVYVCVRVSDCCRHAVFYPPIVIRRHIWHQCRRRSATTIPLRTTHRNELKISMVSHLKYASDEDLKQVGLSKPEIRRLRKFYEKYYPHGYLSKIKRLLQNPTKREDGLVSKWSECFLYLLFDCIIICCVVHITYIAYILLKGITLVFDK